MTEAAPLLTMLDPQIAELMEPLNSYGDSHHAAKNHLASKYA